MELLLVLLAIMWALWHFGRAHIASREADSEPGQAGIPMAVFRECERLPSEIAKVRGEALCSRHGSQERARSVEEARRLLTKLENFAKQYPQINMRGIDAIREDLDAIAAFPLSPISPKVSEITRQGNVIVGFVDLETTGHGSDDQPVALGLVVAEIEMPKGRLVREITTLYEEREPSVPIHPRAAKIHGLKLDDLRGKRFNLVKVREAIQQAEVLVAHSAQFDKRMLAKVVLEVDGWPWRCSVRHVTWPDVLPNRKLDTICRHFSVDRPIPHNALADARALMQCLLQPSGKTARSRTYLGACLARKG